MLQGPAQSLPQCTTGSNQPQSQDHHCRERTLRLSCWTKGTFTFCVRTCFLCPEETCVQDCAGWQSDGDTVDSERLQSRTGECSLLAL